MRHWLRGTHPRASLRLTRVRRWVLHQEPTVSTAKEKCACKKSDSWRCAVDRGLVKQVACRCRCHSAGSDGWPHSDECCCARCLPEGVVTDHDRLEAVRLAGVRVSEVGVELLSRTPSEREFTADRAVRARRREKR